VCFDQRCWVLNCLFHAKEGSELHIYHDYIILASEVQQNFQNVNLIYLAKERSQKIRKNRVYTLQS
jgi:hypothetical protein